MHRSTTRFAGVFCVALVGALVAACSSSSGSDDGTTGSGNAAATQGGCAADTSYSPTFDATATAVLARADAGGPGDTLPPLADDGC